MSGGSVVGRTVGRGCGGARRREDMSRETGELER